jgi:hypothetical protein
MRTVLVRVLGLAAVLGAVAGCGESVKLVPAEGVLTINGQKAANVSIQFMPDVMSKGNGPTSYAVTDADGKFRLKTYDGLDGAVAGPHLVVLVDLDEERTPQGKQPKRAFASRIDPKYAVADPKTGLRAEVTGTAPIELNVTGPK